MKKKTIVLFALALANSLYASWPMESVDKYNIVLVHGAADRWQGLDCENGNLIPNIQHNKAIAF